jgi:hypothetical protein
VVRWYHRRSASTESLVGLRAVAEVRWERFPEVAQNLHARAWLTIQADLGLAANTVEAYGRALEDYFSFTRRSTVEPDSAARATIAGYVHDLTSRVSPRGSHVRVLDSGAGLANATLQQRLTAVRLYYDYLVEEGLRPDNPVGRGRYTPGRGFGGARDRGLIPRYEKLPWIPTDEQWHAVLNAARLEPIRNRFMLALAYDAALRREELCALEIGDIDRPTGRSASGPRRPRAVASASFRTASQRHSLLRPIWRSADNSATSVVHCFAPLPIATARRRSRSGPGRRSSTGSLSAPTCPSSPPIPFGISASPTWRGRTGMSRPSRPSPAIGTSRAPSGTFTSVDESWRRRWRREWHRFTPGEPAS